MTGLMRITLCVCVIDCDTRGNTDSQIVLDLSLDMFESLKVWVEELNQRPAQFTSMSCWGSKKKTLCSFADLQQDW